MAEARLVDPILFHERLHPTQQPDPALWPLDALIHGLEVMRPQRLAPKRAGCPTASFQGGGSPSQGRGAARRVATIHHQDRVGWASELRRRMPAQEGATSMMPCLHGFQLIFNEFTEGR